MCLPAKHSYCLICLPLCCLLLTLQVTCLAFDTRIHPMVIWTGHADGSLRLHIPPSVDLGTIHHDTVCGSLQDTRCHLHRVQGSEVNMQFLHVEVQHVVNSTNIVSRARHCCHVAELGLYEVS